jgi:hypothetical protein
MLRRLINPINIFLALLVIVLIAITFRMAGPANATGDDEPCVPRDAWTEVIEHPAVTETIHHDAVPSLWWNWSPNKDQGPFDGPPDFPVDPRGTWQGPHEEGGPSQDQFGTFQQGNGNGSWFHREPGVDAYDEVRVITPAWTETVEHPAVTCPETETPTPTPTETPSPTTPTPTTPTPTVPTETPTTPTETPTTPESPETPDSPEAPDDNTPATPDKPGKPAKPGQPTQVTECIGGVFVTTVDGEVIAESGSCDASTTQRRTTTFVREEGL